MAADPPATLAGLSSLPSDLLLLIAAKLDPIDLANLAATCTSSLRFVDDLAWRAFVQSRQAPLVLDRTASIPAPTAPDLALQRSVWWHRAKFHLSLSRAWQQKILLATQHDLPLPGHASRAHQKLSSSASRAVARPPPASDFHKSAKLAFAMPYLVLGHSRLVVAVRSDLHLFERTQLTSIDTPSLQALDFSKCHTLHLDTHGRPGSDHSRATPNPWQDITAIKKVDDDCDELVVGFANGTLQRIRIVAQRGKRNKASRLHVIVVETIASPRRREIADVSSSRLAQTDEIVLASISKRGALQVVTVPAGQSTGDNDASDMRQVEEWQIDHEGRPSHRRSTDQSSTSTSTSDGDEGSATPSRSFRSPAFQNAPLTGSTGVKGTRAWCVHVGGGQVVGEQDQRWVAVGLTGDPALFIYMLKRRAGLGRTELGSTYPLTSSGRRTSVFALATPPPTSIVPPYLLFAGFYDGSVRVYDTRQLYRRRRASGSDGGASDEATLRPVATFSDAFGDAAVYSIAFGGVGGCMLLAGNRQHARVRIWDLRELVVRFEPGSLGRPRSDSTSQILTRSRHRIVRPDQDDEDDDDGGDREEGAGREGPGAWFVFPAYPSSSPQYSIVADADRVWGVTDRKVWVLDFGRPCLDLCLAPRSGPEVRGHSPTSGVDERNDQVQDQDEGEGEATGSHVMGTVAYFEHERSLFLRSRLAF
ncbi:uncharacterized protein PSFLO_02397 [Pseudozyma flocculosa]|uniref:F-box domain-containing protein n=2 Tax=Pseudozyma flocculosa TaxID=84751 RepID=A0A5C3EZ84_9BASI|nr:uncharacterized protein PSFLO_02397 [Pseudozyma flocculosa]